MSKLIPGNADFKGKLPTLSAQNQQLAKIVEWLKNSTAIQCDECGGSNFMEVIKIRKVSGLISGLGKDSIIPVPMYACADCGHVNEIFLKNSGLPMENDSKPVDNKVVEK